MALVIETFIICDTCGANFGVDSRNRKGMEQRKSAVENGWVYTAGVDTCPDCRKKKKDGTVYIHSKNRSRRNKNK